MTKRKQKKQIKYKTIHDYGSYGGTLKFKSIDDAERYTKNIYKRFGKKNVGLMFKRKGKYISWS